MPEFASLDKDLPEPSPEQVLLRAMTEAYIATMPRRRAQRFLMTVGETLVSEANLAQAAPRSARRTAQREAANLYRTWLPSLLARMGRD